MVNRRDVVKAFGAIVANDLAPLSAFAAEPPVTPSTNLPQPSGGPNAQAGAGNVPPPPGGLGSNSNYFFYGGGGPIMGLSIVIDVTEDIVAPGGFSIQLNGYSPANAGCNWQQYNFGFYTNEGKSPQLGWSIENWPTDAFRQQLYDTIGLGGPVAKGSDLYNIKGMFGSLPNVGATLPAKYKFQIVLAYDPKDSSGTVIGATFSITDNQEKSKSSGLQLIKSYKFSKTKTSITPDAMAPIVTFQLNISGLNGSRYSFMESGAGTITYSATTPLTVTSKQPAGTAAEGVFTAETANTVYGDLDGAPSRQFVQTLGTAKTPKFRPGGNMAVSRQFDANQTDLFAIAIEGQLVAFSVNGAGHWKQSAGYGAINMADPRSAIAVSKRFGANGQTGVFVVDQSGQLQVFWVTANGVTGPLPISAKGFAARGAPLAASQQFGADQTDVFVFDTTGQLNVFWAKGTGSWNGPVKIGPASFPTGGAGPQLAASQRFGVNRTDVFAVDKTGTLNNFWVDGTGSWQGPEKIGAANFAHPGGHVAVGQRAGNAGQTDVFLVDTKGQLSVFSAQGTAPWSGPAPIGQSGLAVAGAPVAVSTQFGTLQTDVFVTDKKGTLNVFSVDAAGTWSEGEQLGQPGLAPSGAVVAASPQFGVNNQTDVFVINQTGTNAPGWPVVFWVDGAKAWSGPKALVTEV